MSAGCGGCLGAIAIVFVALVIIGVFVDIPEEHEPTSTSAVSKSVTRPLAETASSADSSNESLRSACIDAFASAAGVSQYSDTHEDLFPAYSACKSIEEWREAYALHPAAIDGGNPVQYAMMACAHNQAVLGRTPICRAVNAPSSTGSSLAASGRTGLLGVPLPTGASLTERTRGNPAEYIDPSETYAISATADDITAFFEREMPKAGWYKSTSGLFIEFLKGDLVVGIYVSENKFTLMGS